MLGFGSHTSTSSFTGPGHAERGQAYEPEVPVKVVGVERSRPWRLTLCLKRGQPAHQRLHGIARCIAVVSCLIVRRPPSCGRAGYFR